MPIIVSYKGDLFVLGREDKEKGLLWTRIREKALKYNFIMSDDAYEKWVDLKEIEEIKPYDALDDKYRVKYKEHFFNVWLETENQIQIVAIGGPSEYLAKLYDMDEDYYNGIAKKIVNKSEVIPIDRIKNKRLALYHNIIVCEILDEKNNDVLLSMNIDLTERRQRLINGKWTELYDADGWQKKGIRSKYWIKWVPKNEVFEYSKNNEPLRY